MPELPTANMALVVPTENSDAGTWDETLNTALETIDAHDHTTGKGLPITPAAIDMDDDLPMAGQSLTGVQSVDFNAIASSAVSGRARTLYWDTSDGNLYAKNGSNQTIQITDGGALDVALLGGIGGDYTTTDAELNYDQTNTRYKLLSDASPETYAKAAVSILQLYNTGATYKMDVNPPALAANKSVTLPDAASSGTQLMSINASGVMSCAATITQAQTFDALTVSTADVYHAERTRWISGVEAREMLNMDIDITGFYAERTGGVGAGTAMFPVPMEEGQRIKGFILRGYQQVTLSDFVLTMYIRKDGAAVSTDTQTWNPAGATSWVTNSYTLPTPRVIAAQQYVLFTVSVQPAGGGAPEMRVDSIGIVYDRV